MRDRLCILSVHGTGDSSAVDAERLAAANPAFVVETAHGVGEAVDRLTHYEAEAPPSRSAGLPMLNRKHNRVGWGGSRQHPTVTHAQSQP